MTKHKQTKRALISSMLSLVLCFTMLLGTTFAWFTDSAKTSVNKIQAGTLDVALEMATEWDAEGNPTKWENAENTTLKFADKNGNTNILWEPGATFDLPELRIKNNGDLALKYTVVVTGIQGDAKLNEAIDWIVAYPNQNAKTANADANVLKVGEWEEFGIEGHMKEEAGNEYMGLSIEGAAITVYATQYEHEYDSNNNTYDAAAPLPDIWDGTTSAIEGANPDSTVVGTYHITSAAELAWLMAQTQDMNSRFASATFVLDCDIDFAGRTISGIGSTSANIVFTFDGNGHTISNFTINNTRELYSGLFNQFNGTVKNLNVENATVIGNKMAGVIAANVDAGGVIENCHVKDSTVIANIKKAGAVAGYTAGGTVTGCSATNVNVYCADADVSESGEIVGYVNTGSTLTDNTSVDVVVYRGTTPTLVSTANEFAEALTNKAAHIVLLNDIDAENNWTTPNVNNADMVILGANHQITNLNKPMLNFYGGTLTVNDLTVSASNVTGNAGELGTAVMLEQAQWANLYMDNCHATNCTVTADDTRAAALVGYMVGGAQITNCSVTECEVTAQGSVGAIIGHDARQAGYLTETKVSNCVVENNKLTSTDDGDWRVGTIIGTVAGNPTSINDCTSTNNTLAQTGKTNPNHELYGRISGGQLNIN